MNTYSLSSQSTATHSYTTTELEKKIVASVITNLSFLQKKVIPFIYKSTSSVLIDTKQEANTLTSAVEIEPMRHVSKSDYLWNEEDDSIAIHFKSQPIRKFKVKGKIKTIKKIIPSIYPEEFEL